MLSMWHIKLAARVVADSGKPAPPPFPTFYSQQKGRKKNQQVTPTSPFTDSMGTLHRSRAWHHGQHGDALCNFSAMRTGGGHLQMRVAVPTSQKWQENPSTQRHPQQQARRSEREVSRFCETPQETEKVSGVKRGKWLLPSQWSPAPRGSPPHPQCKHNLSIGTVRFISKSHCR